MKIAVVGAGASGLVAAVILKRCGHDFLLFEREKRAGKKLLATGNGRCNLSNRNISPLRYHGESGFAEYALNKYGVSSFADFMESIGVPCVFEGEKLFPYSLQASSVLDMLRLAEGESEICETAVNKIIPQKSGGFLLNTDKKSYKADKVIVCCGGKAAKKLSGGGCYELLTSLGHSLTPLKAAIVQLKCDGTKALDGVKINADVTLDGKTESGEVLFTSYGLSGPPILQLSRDAKGKTVTIDLAPMLDFGEVAEILRRKKSLGYLTAENLFNGFLNKKLGRELLRMNGVLPFSKNVGEISDKEIKRLAGAVKALPFKITDTNGLENAQVTAGGIKCSEFDPHTMESKIVHGIYAAGEMLNIDGDCGGFNLQWAYSSARLAAESAAGLDI